MSDRPEPTAPVRRGVEIIAHRGYSAAAPENTLAALDAAVVAGAGAVEWDIRVLACGTPVLFHDDTLDRTTDGSGPVDTRKWQDVRKLDAGSWFSRDFAGEPVPTLEEAVDRMRGRIGHLYPEIKAYRNDADLDRMSDIIQKSQWSDRTTFISMDWGALERVRGNDEEVRIGYIVERPERFMAGLERAAGDERAILDPDYRILLEHPAFAAAARARGVELAVWTVDDPEAATRLAALGVTGFTTNRVARLAEWAAA